jgi:hypothetical protein
MARFDGNEAQFPMTSLAARTCEMTLDKAGEKMFKKFSPARVWQKNRKRGMK